MEHYFSSFLASIYSLLGNLEGIRASPGHGGVPLGARVFPRRVQGAKNWFVGPPPGAQMESMFRFVFNAKFISFFYFCMHFGEILHPFLEANIHPNEVRNGKLVFLISSASCRRELNLGGFGTPKSIK